MPDGSEVQATRVAFLEFRDERRLVQEGYELLDEKRVLLAAEILRQLRAHEAARRECAALEVRAREAFEAAVARCGFDELSAEPPRDLAPAVLRRETSVFLGLRLVEAELDTHCAGPATGSLRSLPEARGCAVAVLELTAARARAAAIAVNLRRLAREYVRTERRARALENVVLPEIESSLRFIEEQLDAVDQEEVVRVRNARPT